MSATLHSQLEPTLTVPAPTIPVEFGTDGCFVCHDEFAEAIANSKCLLKRHPHFRFHDSLIDIGIREGRLVLTGQLPSFFLKQLAQEAVREVNLEIDNEIVVSDGESGLFIP